MRQTYADKPPSKPAGDCAPQPSCLIDLDTSAVPAPALRRRARRCRLLPAPDQCRRSCPAPATISSAAPHRGRRVDPRRPDPRTAHVDQIAFTANSFPARPSPRSRTPSAAWPTRTRAPNSRPPHRHRRLPAIPRRSRRRSDGAAKFLIFLIHEAAWSRIERALACHQRLNRGVADRPWRSQASSARSSSAS